jgi:hypothetical protein
MTHILGLYIPESNDCTTQKVIDASTYIESFPVENGLLEVTPPGYDCPVIISVIKNFNTVLTVSNLGISQGNSNSIGITLPDGIYHYKYSVDPNDDIYVEYDVMRTCKLSAKYREAIRQLFKKRVSLGKTIFSENLKQLSYIDQLIRTSQYMVQDGVGDKRAAVELYNEANSLLGDYNNCTTC